MSGPSYNPIRDADVVLFSPVCVTSLSAAFVATVGFHIFTVSRYCSLDVFCSVRSVDRVAAVTRFGVILRPIAILGPSLPAIIYSHSDCPTPLPLCAPWSCCSISPAGFSLDWAVSHFTKSTIHRASDIGLAYSQAMASGIFGHHIHGNVAEGAVISWCVCPGYREHSPP